MPRLLHLLGIILIVAGFAAAPARAERMQMVAADAAPMPAAQMAMMMHDHLAMPEPSDASGTDAHQAAKTCALHCQAAFVSLAALDSPQHAAPFGGAANAIRRYDLPEGVQVSPGLEPPNSPFA